MNLALMATGHFTHVEFLGLALNVPTKFIEKGYLAVDKDGDVWAYSAMPTLDKRCWHSGNTLENINVEGVCLVTLSNYDQLISDLLELQVDGWDKLCIPIKDCPVLR